MQNDSNYAYSLAAGPQAIAARLIRDAAEFSHLREARIVCVRSEPELFLRGEKAFAYVGAARPSGSNSKLHAYLLWAFCAELTGADDPEFLILFDGSSWDGLDDESKEWLVFHELCHIVQKLDEDDQPKEDTDGRPLLAVRSHDYEFFDQEVRRYGPETCRIVGAALAIADGHRTAQRRHRKLRLVG